MSPLLLTAAAAAQPSGMGTFLIQMFPMLLVFIIFYLLVIRPQQRQHRNHQARVMAAKKGDTVVTGGGLIGKVTKVADDALTIDLGNGVMVRAVKGSLSDVLNADGKPAND